MNKPKAIYIGLTKSEFADGTFTHEWDTEKEMFEWCEGVLEYRLVDPNEQSNSEQSLNTCSVCCGAPISGNLCVCSGTGTIQGELAGIRDELKSALELNSALDKELAKFESKIDRIRAEIANIENEFYGLHSVLAIIDRINNE